MTEEKPNEERRTRDPDQDRRSEDERRMYYTPEYFDDGSQERRDGIERRQNLERRKEFTQVSR